MAKGTTDEGGEEAGSKVARKDSRRGVAEVVEFFATGKMPIRRRPRFWRAVRDALALRCPYCGEGRVLARWPNKMRPECARCGLSFFREPGYYIGGMIITYGLTLLIVIPVFLLSVLVPESKGVSDYGRFGLWVLFAVPVSLVLMPYAYSLWLHLDFWLEPWAPGKSGG